MLEIAPASGGRERITLGADLAAGERPQAIVPAHAWQAAQSLGDWTLCGCTVAPGFDFAKFELAPKGWEPNSVVIASEAKQSSVSRIRAGLLRRALAMTFT